jgi:hypothetical protein
LTRERSQFGGTKSSPIPSTAQEPASVIRPVSTSGARIEPAGSASTIAVLGEAFLRKRPTPVSVPPEPTPTTTASTSPSIPSRISGPVLASWAAGLAGFSNWLM